MNRSINEVRRQDHRGKRMGVRTVRGIYLRTGKGILLPLRKGGKWIRVGTDTDKA